MNNTQRLNCPKNICTFDVWVRGAGGALDDRLMPRNPLGFIQCG